MAQKIALLPAEMAHTVRHAAGAFLDDIRQEIEQGRAELVRIENCFFVLRKEQYQNSTELCVVCAEGQNLAKHCRLILDKAKAAGCDSVRFHTNNEKLGRAMRRYGAAEVERVYKIGLS